MLLRYYYQSGKLFLTKIIAEEYALDIEKTLWVEIIHNGPDKPEDIYIATINCTTQLSDQRLFAAVWRSVRPNELKMLEPWMFNMLRSQLQDLNA